MPLFVKKVPSNVVPPNQLFLPASLHWVHWRCSGKRGRRAVADPLFRCGRCRGTARSIHVQTDEEIYVEGKPLESVDSFCYLGDMISAGGGCESAAITRARAAWGKYSDLLPMLSSKSCFEDKMQGL